MSILENKAEEATKAINEQREKHMLTALAATDWDETPIVDIVWIAPDIQTRSFEPGNYKVQGPKMAVERYGSPAPRMEESAVEGERCEIQRVTRPLYEKAQREHPELFQ